MSDRYAIGRPALRTASAVLAALLLGLLVPSTAGAASSGGWHNLGHGAAASDPALTQKVETLLRVGGTLYVGGDFNDAGGIGAADLIATWDGSHWGAVGGGLGSAGRAVYAIAVDGTHVYAGGSFLNAGGDPDADGVAVFDGSHWHSLNHVPLGTVFALAIVGRTLFIGGSFGDADGIPSADGIVAYGLDSHVWSSIQASSGALGTVASIVPDGQGGLFVGGSFANAEGIPQADFVAQWNGGVNWSSVGANPGGTDGAINDRVRGLSRSGNDLYVVGDFTNAANVAAADKVAHWDGAHWSALGSSSAFGQAGSLLYGVLAIDGSVFVTGYFKNAAGDPKSDSIAVFVNGAWTNVGSNATGTDGPVSLNSALLTLAAIGPRVFTGGLESSIGGSPLNAFAASYNMRQPDALISNGGAFVGNGVHNASGTNQSVQRSIARGGNGTFSLRFTNDGLVRDDFTISGPGSGNGFTATYLDGATNVTAQVVAGTYQLANVVRGGSRTLTLKVAVGGGVALDATHTWLVRQTSAVPGGFSDVVKAVAKASP